MTEFEMTENTDPNPPSGPAKKHSPAMALAVERLRMNPDATYQEIKEAATMAGIEVPGIVFGRARSLLGLTPMRPPRPKKKPEDEMPIRSEPRPEPLTLAATNDLTREVTSPTAPPPEPEETLQNEPRRGRPRRDSAASPFATKIDSLVDSVRALEQERDELREALEQIATIIDRLR